MIARTPLIVCMTALAVALAFDNCAADETKPIGQWVFTPENVREGETQNLAGGPPAIIKAKLALVDAGETKALALDGNDHRLTVGDKDAPAGVLRKQFTAESWVRIDEFRRWSRFVGVMARQEDRRKGWFIGTHFHRFVFTLGTADGMTDLHSGGSAHPGQWYHVVGTYDGKEMRLYVNGLLVGRSTERSGEVEMPADTPLSMVDYHDGAEFYPLRGMLHEVRVFDRVLGEEEIRKSYLAKSKLLNAAPPLVMSGCFGDNMVLQQDAPLPVWGRTLPGDKVTVECAGKQAATKADGNGDWSVSLPKLAAGGPHTFTVETPRGKIAYNNVLVGEVWFCAGQSNLAYGTRLTHAHAISQQPYPKIRLFTVVRESAAAPTDFTGGWWEVCDAATVAEFSAVGFVFGRRLHEELKVPIGLFNASWGGTPVESWISRDAMKSLPELAPVLAKEPDDKWERSGLFNQMVNPLVPYAIRGAVWYQGEGNVGNAHQYEKRFTTMIGNWRKRWAQGDFPFYYVQIAPFNYGGKFNTACAELWDAQRRVLTLANTGMAVATDATSTHDNHASNKLIIGERLALWALAKTYGREKIVYSGPLFREMKIEGDRIRVFFDHTADGLKSRDDKPLDWFSIAGDDRNFVTAVATIESREKSGLEEDTIVVHSPDVKKPIAVRFAWSGIAQPNFINSAGLPASPFRTDDWPGILEEKE